MSLLCALFGHKPPASEFYLVTSDAVDADGTEYAFFSYNCRRCEERHVIGRVQLPMRWTEEMLRRRIARAAAAAIAALQQPFFPEKIKHAVDLLKGFE